MDDLVSIEEGTKDYEMLQTRNLISGAIEYVKNYGEEESVTKKFDPNMDEYEIFEELSKLNKPSTAELEWLEYFTRKRVEEAATEYGVGLMEAEHALAQLVEQLSQMKAREYLALDKYEQNRFLLLFLLFVLSLNISSLGRISNILFMRSHLQIPIRRILQTRQVMTGLVSASIFPICSLKCVRKLLEF